MAKQRGLIKLEGTIGGITFLKTRDGYMAKEKTSISAARIASDPAFQRTRENNAEFGQAGKATKLLKNALRIVMQNATDSRMASRLLRDMMKVIKADTTSNRGQRNVIDGEVEFLQGFECNVSASLETTFPAAYTPSINRVSGELTVTVPSFIPARDIVTPEGSTHFRLVSAGTEVDFEAKSYTTDAAATAMLPIGNASTAAITLTNNLTANSTHPLFLLLGIQFYQLVNGVEYPLNNGAFNALRMVKVSGMA
jgi:hypothetical protein